MCIVYVKLNWYEIFFYCNIGIGLIKEKMVVCMNSSSRL